VTFHEIFCPCTTVILQRSQIKFGIQEQLHSDHALSVSEILLVGAITEVVRIYLKAAQCQVTEKFFQQKRYIVLKKRTMGLSLLLLLKYSYHFEELA
jgi:hypothetical protein